MMKIITYHFFLLVLVASITSCQQHKKQADNMTQQENTPHCDLNKGVCETPVDASPKKGNKNISSMLTSDKRPLKIIYFTDPICSSCWGIEPQLRKMKLEYSHLYDIEYKMGGLLPDWSYNSGGISKPSDVASHWDEASNYYGMPIDGDVWLEDPLDSSYPPSIAFRAAQLQGDPIASEYMRAIREMVFLKKINIAKEENLLAAAQQVGLNMEQFKTDLKGKGKADFEADLQLARSMGVRGFPTVIFYNEKQEREVVYGFRSYSSFEKAILKLHPDAQKKTIETSWETLFKKYPTMTTLEFSLLSKTPKIEAEKQLNSLLKEDKLQVLKTKNGVLWIKA